jgi:teichuronic acid biosynthesis glycosyltransferase TuaC
MKVLSFSYCFPWRTRPAWGVFVLQRLAAVARRPGIELQAVAPVPVFPVLTRCRSWLPPARDTLDGLQVHYPRFFYVPGLLKSLDARLYARGLRPWLTRLVDQWKPDLLDAHFVWPDGVGVSLLAKRLNLPYMITLRGWLYEAMKYPRILRQCVAALRDAGAIIAVSQHLANTAAELGAPVERIRVVPNGVDQERFRPRDQLDARGQLGLPKDGRLVVTVSHLGPRKGHHEVLRALARLPDDVRLVLVGSDPEGGRNVRALRELADNLGLNGRLILAGQQPYDKVPLYFNAADVSVLASYREGCPNVVLESLASGTPVVASNVGSVPEMIEDGRNGRVVPPQQVAPLAQGIRDVLDRPPEPQEVLNSPAVRSWDVVAEEVCGILRQCAAPSGSAGGRG